VRVRRGTLAPSLPPKQNRDTVIGSSETVAESENRS
jgi:hypothetical protein